MRPRVFPAENLPASCGIRRRFPGFNEAAGIPRGKREPRAVVRQPRRGASMRPRVFPAENFTTSQRKLQHSEASMRPRVFPAENDTRWYTQSGRDRASMRPRVFPAENVWSVTGVVPPAGELQ